MAKNILEGKVVTSIEMTDDQKAIKFITEDGDIVVKADGDCCSSTWIENIELPALGLPATVVAVENLDMPDLGSPSEYEVIEYYGCKIITDKGEMIIDYRNESNGYYGGNLSWPGDGYFYGGVYGQNIHNDKWEKVA